MKFRARTVLRHLQKGEGRSNCYTNLSKKQLFGFVTVQNTMRGRSLSTLLEYPEAVVGFNPCINRAAAAASNDSCGHASPRSASQVVSLQIERVRQDQSLGVLCEVLGVFGWALNLLGGFKVTKTSRSWECCRANRPCMSGTLVSR